MVLPHGHPLRCNRTRARPGPQHDHTIWSCCGPEIIAPQHNHTTVFTHGVDYIGKYHGRALVLRHRIVPPLGGLILMVEASLSAARDVFGGVVLGLPP